MGLVERRAEPLDGLAAPLSRSGVVTLVSEHGEVADPDRVADACIAIAGGNPTLTRALLADNAPAHAGAPLHCGPMFRNAVRALLDHTDSGTHGTAVGLAVLAEAATVARVAEVLGADHHEVSDAVDTLTRAGLARDLRLRHRVLAEAVLAATSEQRRTLACRRAAEVLYRDGFPAGDVADRLAHAGGRGTAWSVDVFTEAARQALFRDEVGTAARLYELADRDCVDDRRRHELRAERAMATWRTDPAAAARSLDQCPANSGTGLFLRARYALWQGNPRHAANLLTTLGTSVPHPAALTLTCRWLYGSHRAERLFARTDPGPDPLTTLARPDRAADVDALEHLLHGYRLDDTTLEPLTYALWKLVACGRWDTARQWCESLLDEAGIRRAPVWQALLGVVRAEIALHSGDLAEARRQAETALPRMGTASWGVLLGFPLATLLHVATVEGRHDDAESLLTHPVPGGMADTVPGLRYRCARGRHYLARNRPHTAIADFHTCARLALAWDVDEPAWRTGLVQAYTALGEHELARWWADEAASWAASGVRASRPPLSAAETRVATLAALGYTNREISDRLCITGSTVEQHLTRTYRKLAVTGRSQLTEIMPVPPELRGARRR